MSKRQRTHSTGLVVVFALLMAVVLRPAGPMMVMDGGTFTYVICTGNGPLTLTVGADGETERDYESEPCDFFAAQIAALTTGSSQAEHLTSPSRVASGFASDITSANNLVVSANGPRAPPVLG